MIFYGAFCNSMMASRARGEFLLGTGLVACVCFFCGAPLICSADFAPPVASEKTNAESAALNPPNLQEQQDLVQQAIEQTRREAEAALKRNTDVLAARLNLIEKSLDQHHKRELEMLENSNRSTLLDRKSVV